MIVVQAVVPASRCQWRMKGAAESQVAVLSMMKIDNENRGEMPVA